MRHMTAISAEFWRNFVVKAKQISKRNHNEIQKILDSR